VLLDSPVEHLEETDSQKEVATQALSLHSEHCPAKSFVEVVCARNVAESPSVRNTTCCGAGFAEISQDTVALEVEELKEQEQAEEDIVELVGGPGWRGVVRMQEKVHGENAKEEPIVS
jgi:hypothetical protein